MRDGIHVSLTGLPFSFLIFLQLTAPKVIPVLSLLGCPSSPLGIVLLTT